jgi:D-glycero-D-manno-heptose 1,7-bisphosphate phosphatase
MSAVAVFLDRDGTILREAHYLSDPDRVELLPGAGDALAALRDAGYRLIVVTNQSGIGRGLYTEDDYRAVASRVDEVLADVGVGVERTYYCPHATGDSMICNCRKPALGMYRRAEEELGIDLAASWYVGDKVSDVRPALALGGRGILVRTGYGTDHEARVPDDVRVVDDIGAAAALILAEGPPAGDDDNPAR